MLKIVGCSFGQKFARNRSGKSSNVQIRGETVLERLGSAQFFRKSNEEKRVKF